MNDTQQPFFNISNDRSKVKLWNNTSQEVATTTAMAWVTKDAQDENASTTTVADSIGLGLIV